jgi:hypothetical protein
MNVFPAAFTLIFWISLVYFVINPAGFIEESERVLRAPGPMIVGGHMAFPQGRKTTKRQKKSSGPAKSKSLPTS